MQFNCRPEGLSFLEWTRIQDQTRAHVEQQQFIETRVSHTRYLHPIICYANAYLHSQKDNTNYSERESHL